MTYRELLIQLQAFTPEQMAADVRWWGDDRGGVVRQVQVLAEDYVRGEEGCFAISDFEPTEEEPTPTVQFPKGTPILSVD